MALPMGGSCVTPDGSMAETHLHIVGVTINHATKARAHAEAAEAICRQCPVLDACRGYAALSRWQGVTVAGWSAPSHTSAFPPWAIIRCTLCGSEQNDSERYSQRCELCREWIESQVQHRWMAYVGEVRASAKRDALLAGAVV